MLPVEWKAVIPVLVMAGVFCLWRKRREDGCVDASGRSLMRWFLPLFFFCALGAVRLREDRAQMDACRLMTEALGECRVRIAGQLSDVRAGKGESYAAVASLKNVTVCGEGEKSFGDPVFGEEEKAAALSGPGAPEAEVEKARQMRRLVFGGDVLVYLKEAPDMEKIHIGMEVSVRGSLESMGRATNPGEFDFAEYYHALGVEGRCFAETLERSGGEMSPYLDDIWRVKRYAAEILGQICDADDAALFQAVILGDKTALSADIRDLYQKNGIAHLLAVSGLHVSLIGLGFYHLLRRGGAGFAAAGLAAAALTVTYGVLTGGSASVVRAAAMICFQLLADRLGRTYDLLSAMAAAALLLLWESPSLLFQAGFQLSFGAVLAIGAVCPVLAQWLRVGKGFRQTLLFGAALQAVTLPLTAYHFYEYPIYSVLLNLAVIPLMGYVVISVLAGICCGAVWIPAGRFAVGTGHWILVFYEWLCRQFARLPGAVQIIGRPRNGQLVLYALLWGGLLLWASWDGSREGWREDRREESRVESREDCREDRAIGARLLAVLSCMVFGFVLLQPLRPDGLRVTFLDVGQGDGICLESGGHTMLIDGGSTSRKDLGEGVLEPFLKSRGVRQVDYAIVSHGDEDHISGLRQLLKSDCGIRIDCLVLPRLGRTDAKYEELVRLAEAVGTEVFWMGAGDRISMQKGCQRHAFCIWDGEGGQNLEVECLYAGDDAFREDTNDHSLLLKASCGRAGFLFTGDMSAEGERRWLQTRMHTAGTVQVLKVAHHGSNYSSCGEFLDQTAPEWAVISCGANNRYGHPGQETLQRLSERGIRCFLTMEDGAVTVVTDGERMTAQPFLDGKR